MTCICGVTSASTSIWYVYMSCMCSITCPVHHVWHNRWGVLWVWAHMVSCMWDLMCAASYMRGIMRMVCRALCVWQMCGVTHAVYSDVQLMLYITRSIVGVV